MTLPATPDLLAVAQRVIWFCPPEEALRQPYLFLAHVMTYATIPDVVLVKRTVGMDAFKEALANAPAGVFDGRSWAYWHLMCGCDDPPPLPQRRLL